MRCTAQIKFGNLPGRSVSYPNGCYLKGRALSNLFSALKHFQFWKRVEGEWISQPRCEGRRGRGIELA